MVVFESEPAAPQPFGDWHRAEERAAWCVFPSVTYRVIHATVCVRTSTRAPSSSPADCAPSSSPANCHLRCRCRRPRGLGSTPSEDGVAHSRFRAGGRAREEQRALARVARERGGALELRPRLVDAAELREQVAAHARQQVVVPQRRLVGQRVDELEARLGPERHRRPRPRG